MIVAMLGQPYYFKRGLRLKAAPSGEIERPVLFPNAAGYRCSAIHEELSGMEVTEELIKNTMDLLAAMAASDIAADLDISKCI